MKKVNLLDFFSLIYLYLPVVIFFISWINPLIGIPAAVVCCYLVYQCSQRQAYRKIQWDKIWPFLIVALVVIILWELLSGLGGFFQQSYDWQKHNVLMGDLVNRTWPVHYHFRGENGVMSYYIGEYIIPALIGKLAGFTATEISLLIWVTLGIVLVTFSIYRWINSSSGWTFIVIIMALLLFAPLIYPLNGIYLTWNPQDSNYMGSLLGEWFSKGLLLNYSSNITQLRFAFSQFVPITLMTSIWLRRRTEYQVWGTVLAPSVLYSTFTFLGLLLVMLSSYVYDVVKHKKILRQLFKFENVLALFLMLVLVLYIACNILQPKPMDDSMRFALTDFWNHKLAFIVFQGAWMLWFLILLKYENRNPLLYIAGAILLILPFFRYGAANDLVMRVSLPALLLLNFLIMRGIIQCWKNDRFYSLLLICLLLISGAGPLWQLKDTANRGVKLHNYNMPYESGTKFFKSDRHVVYQYVDWHEGKLRQFIIRK